MVYLKDVNDVVFSQEIMGKGVAINPTDNRVVSPFNGEVVTVFKTKHAMRLKSDDGVEVLIHIGLDTVELEGKYYNTYLKAGDKIKVGLILVEFDIQKIKEAGYETTTPIIITNTAQYLDILTTNQTEIKEIDRLLTIVE